MNDGVICWDPSPPDRPRQRRRPSAFLAARAGCSEPGDAPGKSSTGGQPAPQRRAAGFRVLRSSQPVTGVVLGCSRPTGSPAWLWSTPSRCSTTAAFARRRHLLGYQPPEGRPRPSWCAPGITTWLLLESFPAQSGGPEPTPGALFQPDLAEFTGRSGGGTWRWLGRRRPPTRACLASYRPFRAPALRPGIHACVATMAPTADPISAGPSRMDGFAGYLGACSDVTDRREADDRLRLAARVWEESGEAIDYRRRRTHRRGQPRLLRHHRPQRRRTGGQDRPCSLRAPRRRVFPASPQALGRGLPARRNLEPQEKRRNLPELDRGFRVRDGGGDQPPPGIFSDITEKKIEPGAGSNTCRTTMPSPACPTARSSANVSTWPWPTPSAPATRWRCFASTWTALGDQRLPRPRRRRRPAALGGQAAARLHPRYRHPVPPGRGRVPVVLGRWGRRGGEPGGRQDDGGGGPALPGRATN